MRPRQIGPSVSVATTDGPVGPPANRSLARTPRIDRVVAAVAVTAVAALILGGCQIGVLYPRGPVGEAQRTILFTALMIMLAIVVPTILATFLFAFWFRESNSHAHRRPDWAYSGRVELVTWSIPVLVVMFLGGIAWVGSHELAPEKPLSSPEKPLEIEVVSLDWKWLFILPEQRVAAVNELVVPVGRPLALRLTSASVFNAFFVPQLGSMIYTMNGMATKLHLQADREGRFLGLSSHFSGDGFPGMHFAVRAVPPEAFDGWVTDAGRSETKLDRATYEALARPSSNVAPATYREAEPDLFRAIVSGEIPPAPGPASNGIKSSARFDPAFAAICTPAAPYGRGLAAATPARPRG